MPIPDSIFRQFCFSCPFSNRQILSVKFQIAIVAFIGSLFFACSPFAVPWFIIALIIFSFYAFSSRRFTHISKEVFKLFPSFAVSDSASAIVTIVDSVLVVATPFYCTPNIVSARKTLSMCLSGPNKFTSPTSAAFSWTTGMFETGNMYGSFIAALTETVPSLLTGIFKDKKSFESLTNTINQLRHSFEYSMKNQGVTYTV